MDCVCINTAGSISTSFYKEKSGGLGGERGDLLFLNMALWEKKCKSFNKSRQPKPRETFKKEGCRKDRGKGGKEYTDGFASYVRCDHCNQVQQLLSRPPLTGLAMVCTLGCLLRYVALGMRRKISELEVFGNLKSLVHRPFT